MPHYENRSKSAGRGQIGSGFTLAEMMVVVAVIAVLVSILLPSLNGVYAMANKTSCQGNLFRITQTLHADTRGNANISSGYNWLGVTLANAENSRDLVWCPADTRDRTMFSANAQMRALERFYVLQYHTNSTSNPDCSYFPDIFGGKPVPDGQVWAIYPRGGINQPPKSNWPTVPHVAENQAFVGIDSDAACMITFKGSSILFESVVPPDSVGYSRHYILEGNGTHPGTLPGGQLAGDADDKRIIRLWGWDNTKLDPSVSITMGAQTSYGVNSLVEEKNWRPEQIFVMDANDLVVEVGSAAKEDFLDEVLLPRHMGKLNVTTCDGAVKTMTVLEMEMELEKYRSLWRSR